MYLFIFLFVFLFNPLWSDGVTNPVHGLPSDCHQRSLSPLYWLSHHTDCYTSPWTTFPMFHCTDWIHLKPITHTLFYTHSDSAQVAEYCLLYRSSSDSTFRSQFLIWVLSSSSSSRSLVTSCFLIISLCWIIPLSCCLDYVCTLPGI